MGKLIDLTGQVFGRWLVIERTRDGKVRKGHDLYWLCRCECGIERAVAGSNLRRGISQSCGCLCRDRKLLPNGQAAFNMVYRRYKYHAEERNLVFELTKEDISFLTKMNCHYCGTEPEQVSRKPNTNGGYIHNGIDRIDNTEGYTMDNVVPCCGLCNYWKRTMTVTEFINHAKQITKHQAR